MPVAGTKQKHKTSLQTKDFTINLVKLIVKSLFVLKRPLCGVEYSLLYVRNIHPI